MKHISLFIFFLTAAGITVHAQLVHPVSADYIGSHKIVLDKDGRFLSWYEPDRPGAAYAHVADLASKFIKSGVPVDPASGLKLYFISCGFDGPHMNSPEKFNSGKTWSSWLHDPACVFAGMVKSLALDYRVYSGDEAYVGIVKEMLDFQLAHGTTPADWPWANVPYASSDGGNTDYHGGIKYAGDGRGDGLYGVEPDKIAELGNGYLSFYEIGGDERYEQAALLCADALAGHIRDTRPADSTLALGRADQSPWPFRVNAKTDVVTSEYCSDVIEPIRLFDELLRIGSRIGLATDRASHYQQARNIAWQWLFSKNGPMKTFIWNAYFEDIPNDATRANRVQITPLETARYLLQHCSGDKEVMKNIPVLLDWVKLVFSEPKAPAINEQTWCYEPMASHTARFASVSALWYEYSKDERYREDAYRYFNYATYLTDTNGVVRVGPNWPGSWFSDGYGDYIRHFLEGLAAVPQWAPASENHLLRSSSVVQRISYSPTAISYSTFDDSASEVLRLSAKPIAVQSGKIKLKEFNAKSGREEGWSWLPLKKGGILKLVHLKANDIRIALR